MVTIVDKNGRTLAQVRATLEEVTRALSRGGFNLLVVGTTVQVLPCAGGL